MFSFFCEFWWWPRLFALRLFINIIMSRHRVSVVFVFATHFCKQRKWNDERNYNIYDYDAFHSLWREIRRRRRPRCRCISFHLICSSSELIRLRPFSVLDQFISFDGESARARARELDVLHRALSIKSERRTLSTLTSVFVRCKRKSVWMEKRESFCARC